MAGDPPSTTDLVGLVVGAVVIFGAVSLVPMKGPNPRLIMRRHRRRQQQQEQEQDNINLASNNTNPMHQNQNQQVSTKNMSTNVERWLDEQTRSTSTTPNHRP